MIAAQNSEKTTMFLGDMDFPGKCPLRFKMD